MRLPHAPSPTRTGQPLLAALLILTGWIFAVPAANAQMQDRVVAERLEKAGTLEYVPASKIFSPSSKNVDKAAPTRAFGFSHAAATSGDGTYRTRGFASGLFQTGLFGTKKATLTVQGAAQGDRKFDTKTMAVGDDRAAGKSASVQNYQPSEKPFISHGRRQDEIDELRRQKNLTSEQVREILNKNK